MSAINPQASELNDIIEAENASVTTMLSAKGKGIFFPAKGILGQTAAAKGKRINATIGIALEDDGTPMRLPAIEKLVSLPPAAVFPYAPSFGDAELRRVWLANIRGKNPSLGDTQLSTPVVTNALTHALSIAGYLFLDPGDTLILPDLYWGNYNLIFKNGYDAKLATHTTFVDGAYHVDGLRQALKAGGIGKKVVLLNFPNNPTGYTATEAEMDALRDVLVAAASAGNDLVVLIDDAYFGLVYEDGVGRESMFAKLADSHERLLAVKIDGATKEDYVWGLRVGFLTYAVRGGTAALYSALEAKTAGAVRGNISNASQLSQSLVKAALQSDTYAVEKEAKFEILQRRYTRIKEILAAHPEYSEAFVPAPFNSGYFLCLQLEADPERVRQILLKDFDTGTIAASGLLRIAFSATPFGLLEDLFANIFAATKAAQAE
ncbi:MAG TPA: hypothetical protein DCR55_01505 [Lentisphaeria bacterium]|jgi:aspartate/methionine/tyrosine aminotransferase|nr:hypothetical protein [Lentisphaeria bacterium]